MTPVISPRGHDESKGASRPPLIPMGLASDVTHQANELTVRHDGWAPAGSDTPTLGGARLATYRIDGASLIVEERLRFDDPDSLPGPLSISIAETPERPLVVEVSGASGPVQAVNTSGISEWRSFWGELPRVHQIEIEPAAEISLTWKVTPRLRVASSITGHQYDRSLYQHLQERFVVTAAGLPDQNLARRLRDIDILHMAWPEWWAGTNPARNAEVISILKRTGTKVVWTQHNLLPHLDKSDQAHASYQLWAEAADAVIHHTRVGLAAASRHYRYGPETTHHVIPHGHWGAQYKHLASTDRAAVERDERWAPADLRLAVVGSPRKEKRLQLVIDAVAGCQRQDLQLVIRVDDAVNVPDDPRIIAEFSHLDERRYERRMAAFDALILPFDPEGMLTTGTAFDAIGAGVPAITSGWDFFDETFDGADIRYGDRADELTACLNDLTPAMLASAATATRNLQSRYEWADSAAATAEVFQSLA